jgi:hypothetical protein
LQQQMQAKSGYSKVWHIHISTLCVAGMRHFC